MNLNYAGDVTHIVGEVKGPDIFGASYVATNAVYDEETNMTRVEFEPQVRAN